MTKELKHFEAGYRSAMAYVKVHGSADTYVQLQQFLRAYKVLYEDKLNNTRRTWCFTEMPPLPPDQPYCGCRSCHRIKGD